MLYKLGSRPSAHYAVAWLAIAIAPIVVLASSCGVGPQAPVAGTPAPVVPAAPGPAQVSSPLTGASVTSPFQISVDVPGAFNYMDLIADGTPIFHTSYPSIQNKWVFLPVGQHNLVFQTYDANNAPMFKTTMQVNVTAETPNASITEIQRLPQFQSCTAHLFGGECASGIGDAIFAMTQNQTTPSLSGNSSRFDISGPTGYSNALFWNQLGGGTLLNHFTYAVDFYISDGSLSEALEFDANQSVGGKRYVYGTECSFLNTKLWDVWDPANKIWVKTNVPCLPFTSQTWHHLEWVFERVGNQVHYVSVTVDGVTTPVDMFFDAQSNYPFQGFDVAFQMDGNFAQAPYSVWLDNWTLTASY